MQITQKTATQLLLPFSYEENWYRGEEYADKKLVRLQTFDSKAARAKVQGTQMYLTTLRFAGTGLVRDCSCPYVGGDVCKHMIALAIIWDEKRGLARPTKQMVATETIPPPLVSMTQITASYKNPLEADLEVLRMAASERGPQSHSHLRLPLSPPMGADPRRAISASETKRALREIMRWSRRDGYDMYLCGGEMVAAFCEVLRRTMHRFDTSQARIAVDLLLEAQLFYENLLNELVDVRDGIEVFGQAHLDELYRLIDAATKKLSADERLYV